MADDPFALFDAWYAEARLSRSTIRGRWRWRLPRPMASRRCAWLLLKVMGARHTFYTNADSRRARSFAANPQAALLFHWKSLRRQVRIEGPSRRSAPRRPTHILRREPGSQIGAHA
jgi:pyridoxamine 5'-phosphate oxidase